MYILFFAFFATGGIFMVDEQVHPERYQPAAYHEVQTGDGSIHIDAPAEAAGGYTPTVSNIHTGEHNVEQGN